MRRLRPLRSKSRERRVALAFIDAACLLGVDGRGEPTEVHFAEDMAVWLLAIDWATASSLVRERLQHLTTAGRDAVRASIAERLPTKAERDAAYLVASAAIYRDDHFAHRQARALVDLAGILQLDRASVDRLSTNDPRPLGALYPSTGVSLQRVRPARSTTRSRPGPNERGCWPIHARPPLCERWISRHSSV